jgi:hypothetical protein
MFDFYKSYEAYLDAMDALVDEVYEEWGYVWDSRDNCILGWIDPYYRGVMMGTLTKDYVQKHGYPYDLEAGPSVELFGKKDV